MCRPGKSGFRRRASRGSTESAACIDALESSWGDRLAQFTVTQAASDLAHLVDATRTPGQKLFIYGVSYGTTWAMRFMQLRPADATGVVLDSVVAPGALFLSRFDLGFDPVARKLAAACAVNPVCRAKLGADPWVRMTDVFAALDRGACPALGLDRPTWSAVASLLIQFYDLRTLVFPLFYRLARCSPQDVAAFSRFFTILFTTEDRGPERGSWALQWNIGLSELWEMPAPDAAEIARRKSGAYFWPGELDAGAALHGLWPRYPLDEFANRWPLSSVPVLAMNGTFNPQTPVETARLAATAFTAPYQSFVEFPGAPMASSSRRRSPIRRSPPAGCRRCSRSWPTRPRRLRSPVKSAVLPLAFAWDPDLLLALFGTSDAWENPITPAAGPSPNRAAAAAGASRPGRRHRRGPPPAAAVTFPGRGRTSRRTATSGAMETRVRRPSSAGVRPLMVSAVLAGSCVHPVPVGQAPGSTSETTSAREVRRVAGSWRSIIWFRCGSTT